MGFLGVYNAVYDYTPQGDQELAIQEGDLLFVIDKSSEDGWWNAKKRAAGEDDDEPVGLIPNNYVQEAKPTHRAKALFDYTRQTDEELSFNEDAPLHVYDTSDPDWTLAGLNGEYGFVPANYIELSDASETAPRNQPPPLQTNEAEYEPEQPPTPNSVGSPVQSPAAALAGILSSKGPASPVESPPLASAATSRRPVYTPEASDEEPPSPPAPSLPVRRSSQPISSPPPNGVSHPPDSPGIVASPPHNRLSHRAGEDDDPQLRSPRGFHLYNISEMVSAMGKQKKMPTTLGINVATGTILIAPAKSRDGPEQEWTAEKLSHYSIEGKHVFLELVRPSKSADFHAGAKDTAEEIVSGLGEIAGAARAEGLREVIEAGSGDGTRQKKGHMQYEFMAQGDDEVTVAVGDEIIILDDSKSDEWWMVRRLKNGKEGVVPSSYVEITGLASVSSPGTRGMNASRSTIEQNRLEEERLAKAAAKQKQNRRDSETRSAEVGPGMRLPERGSSLHGNSHNSQRNKRESKGDSRNSSSKPRPDSARIRTWTDRSASFKVDAAFLGCTDGKIHLHKLNGVKIAVPVVKMAVEDLEYVERITGMSLDEDKPLSDIKRRSHLPKPEKGKTAGHPDEIPPPAISKDGPKLPEYDWFDFFLQCGVPVHQCERYAYNFTKDSMDESILPDITPNVLRTLGLKEGDILRVTKFLDNKYGRSNDARGKRNVSFGGAEVMGNGEAGLEESATNAGTSPGGLFSGPSGTLRNNTRKGRPAPAVQTNDTVDPKAFEQKGLKSERTSTPSEGGPTPSSKAPPPVTKDDAGFDDDAWDVKPSKQTQQASRTPAAQPPSTKPSSQQQPALTGSMQELSILSPPLQPTVAHTSPSQQPSQSQLQPQSQHSPQSQIQPQPPQTQQAQPTGPTPSFFGQLSQQQQQNTAMQQLPGSQITQAPTLNPSQTGYGLQQQQAPMQNNYARQRPAAPSQNPQNQGSLMPPPPPRPLSAPQNASQQSSFGPPPLQPQLTGYQYSINSQPQMAPPGQSLNDLRYQQTGQQSIQTQPTGYGPQSTGQANQTSGLGQFGVGAMPTQNGFGQLAQGPQNVQPMQQISNGQFTGSPFANPGPQQQQATGSYQSSFSHPNFQQPLQTGGLNANLPPALQPQPTGFGGFSQGFAQSSPPPVPPIPQQNSIAPLQAQKTGPAPSIRFGVPADKKLTPQPTGRKANLSQATPQNPFGF
ncbi:MAG: cytoskeletal protein binding protein [Sclerophora amabilis]|nr:MAG: cytoskeletal protein binding protein [Sclerophora amabilis]